MKILLFLFLPIIFATTISSFAQVDFAHHFRLAAFDVKSSTLSDSIVLVVSDSLRKGLASIGVYYLISQENISMAKQETGIEKPVVNNDYVRLARKVAADKVVFGTLEDVGETYEIKVHMVDVATRRIEREAGFFMPADQDSILKLASAVMWQLFFPHDNSRAVEGIHRNFSPAINRDNVWKISTLSMISIGIIASVLGDRVLYHDDIDTPLDSLQIVNTPYSLFHAKAIFNNNGYSVRGHSMAGAYTGLADDAFGFIYNPAGLARIESRRIGMSYVNNMSLINSVAISYSDYLTANSFFGNAFMYTGGDGLMSEWTFLTSYAYMFKELWFLPVFTLGANVKFRNARFGYGENSYGIDRVQGNSFGVGLDLGGTANITDYLVGGMALIDAFNYQKWNNYLTNRAYREDLPREFKMGLAYKFSERFVFTMDWFKALYENQSEAIAFGVEVIPFDFVALRAGVFQDGDDSELSKIALGTGINHVFDIIGYGLYAVNFDYGFEYFNRINNSHRLSLSVEF